LCFSVSAQLQQKSASPNAESRKALVIKVPYLNDLNWMIKRKNRSS